MRNKSTRKCIKRGWILLLAILLLTAQSSFADIYSFDFTGDVSVWDISGSYTEDSIGCDINYDLTQDAAGKFTGGGNVSCTMLGVDIDMSFTVKGSIKQKNGVATVKMIMKFTGTASDGWDTYKFKASAKVKAEINSAAGTINGTVKARISISGYGSESDTLSYTEDLPPDMDGTFTMELNVNENGGKLLGTGEVILSNGDTYNFSIKGKYNAKKDESKLTLKGDGSSKKCKFKIVIDESGGQMTSLKGKALGQKLKETWN